MGFATRFGGSLEISSRLHVAEGRSVVCGADSEALGDADNLLERSRRLLGRIHPEDQEDAIDLHERIDSAIASRNTAGLNEACDELKELLFFVEDH